MRSVSLLEDSGITPHSTEKSEVTKWLIKHVLLKFKDYILLLTISLG